MGVDSTGERSPRVRPHIRIDRRLRRRAGVGMRRSRAVVFIAERLLSPATIEKAKATLAAAPIDPMLRRFCDPVTDDSIADSATWADDYRDIDARTFGWHFINVPRNATVTRSNERQYCPAATAWSTPSPRSFNG
jgi:hypothetical protein